jgi:antitoxin VapB
MNTGRVFKSGNSQAVRLPKEFQFSGDQVYIKRAGRNVILIPKDEPWDIFERSLDEFTNDFMEGPRLRPSLEDPEDWG